MYRGLCDGRCVLRLPRPTGSSAAAAAPPAGAGHLLSLLQLGVQGAALALQALHRSAQTLVLLQVQRGAGRRGGQGGRPRRL